MLALSHPRYYPNRLRNKNVCGEAWYGPRLPPMDQAETDQVSHHPRVVSGSDFWFNCVKWFIFEHCGAIKMAISNDSTQEMWEGIWEWPGPMSLLQFPGNTHPDCSNDPKCTASAGHSDLCRGIRAGPSPIPRHSPHAHPRQVLMSGGGTEQAYFNSYSPFFQEVTDRQLASSPQDSYSPVSPGPLTGSENASWLLTLWRMFLLVLFDNCRYFFLVEKRRNQDGWMNGW